MTPPNASPPLLLLLLSACVGHVQHAPAETAPTAIHASHKGTAPSPLVAACRRGDAEACYQHAWRREDGSRAPRYDAHANAALARACELGLAKACTDVGYRYAYGKGLPRDRERAVKLYDRACIGGDALGCNNLASSFEHGNGVPREPKRAAALYEDACKRKVALACANLGRLYRLGRGVKRSYATAADLLEKACAAHKGLACYHLGWMAARGEGRVVDTLAALDLFRKGCSLAKIGCAEAARFDAVREELPASSDQRCQLEGLWFSSGATFVTSAARQLAVGKLFTGSYYGVIARLALRQSKQGQLPVALAGPRVVLTGKVVATQSPLLYLKRPRRLSAVLWLRPHAPLRWRGSAGGTIVVEPALPSAVRNASPPRPTVPCEALALSPPVTNDSTWPKPGPASMRRLRGTLVPVAARAGGPAVLTLDLSSKYAMREAQRLERAKGYSRIRYTAYRYAVDGWVPDRVFEPDTKRDALGGLLGVGGLGMLGGKAASQQTVRRCSRDVPLYASDGKQRARIGTLRKGARFRERKERRDNVMAIEVIGLGWLRPFPGVELMLKVDDLATHCS